MPADAEKAMRRVVDACGRFFRLRDVRRHRLEADYRKARRAGYFQDAGIELTVKGEDALSSPETSDAG